MEARDVIFGQVERLRQELIRSGAGIDSLEIDAHLRDGVAPRFDTALKQLKDQNSTLEKKVKDGEPLHVCWRHLRKLQDDSTKLFDECLAVIQGAWARKHGLDEGVCALTDALLDDLAHCVSWRGFTLLATSEFYRPTAEIIRIRYPEVSLWSLPLAAHEFGHYAGPELRHSQDGGHEYPFQARLKVADEARVGARHTKEWHHIQEYFADVFAIYTLGPAYAAALILLRMNPSDAYTETATHPSGAARVHGILWMLDKMDEGGAARLRSPFRDVTGSLRGLWETSLEAAGQPTALSAPAVALVMQRMTELFEMLVDTTPQRLQFSWADWLRAQGMAADLATKTLPEQLTRRDVLNAAWLARLQLPGHNPHALNDIAREAWALYRRIAAPQQRVELAPGP